MYKPPEAFSSKALQHTKVSLTWDLPPPSRARMLQKKLSKDEYNEVENDLLLYMASDDSGAEGRKRHEASLCSHINPWTCVI